PSFPLGHYRRLIGGVLVLWTFTGFVLGIYRRVELRSPLQIIGDESRLVLVGMVLAIAGLYVLRADVSRSLMVTFGVLDAILLVAGRLGLCYSWSTLRRLLGRFHCILIIGTCGEVAG